MRNAILAICTLLVAAPGTSVDLVVRNVHLVDVEGDRVSAPVSLLVRDGFIRGIHGVEEALAGERVVNGQGGYLIPGLAEMHAHVPSSQDRQQVQDVLLLYLAHGVTTIRGMLGQPAHLELKRDLADGLLPGPRLLTSGPSFSGGTVTSPDEAAAMVRVQAEAGYDFLKLHPGLSREVFDAIVEAADELGIDYAGHVSTEVGVERAIAARQITIDHLDGYAQALVPEDHELSGNDPGFFGIDLVAGLDEAGIPEWARRTADAGVWNVPTQTLLDHLAGEVPVDELVARPAMRYVPEAVRQQWRDRVVQMRERYSEAERARFLEVRMALIGALHAAGAGILLGADAPQIMNVPGFAVHEELALYVAAGLSPAEAMATGTVNVARFLGESAHGCLREGCVADLVLLAENPLEDILNTRAIRGVARAGTWYDRETLDEALEAIAARAAQ